MPLVELAPAPLARRLFNHADARVFDLLDVCLANAMLAVTGSKPLVTHASRRGLVSAVADHEQVTALRAISGDTAPRSMEAWMLSLAPALTHHVVGIVGTGWTAEAELSVELALALRADDISDFAEQLAAGPVDVEGTRSAAAVIAADVPDPALIHFV